jgi:hypothetical protein
MSPVKMSKAVPGSQGTSTAAVAMLMAGSRSFAEVLYVFPERAELTGPEGLDLI